MTSKQKQIDKMADEVIITGHHITCNKCQRHDEIAAYDELSAAEHYFNKGWRTPKLLTYCPKCSKKYLKKKL